MAVPIRKVRDVESFAVIVRQADFVSRVRPLRSWYARLGVADILKPVRSHDQRVARASGLRRAKDPYTPICEEPKRLFTKQGVAAL